MKRTHWKRWIACGALVGCAAWCGQTIEAQEKPQEPAKGQAADPAAVADSLELFAFAVDQADPKATAERTAEEGTAEEKGTAAKETTAEPPMPAYWIGIGLGELPELARKHLKIDGGLVVSEVFEDSPAAKAEFKPDDILLKAGDTPVKEPADILKAVDEAKENELRVVVLRDGQELTIPVKPIKRPKPEGPSPGDYITLAPNAETSAQIKHLEQLLFQLKSKAGNEPLGIWFARPGIVSTDNVLNLKVATPPKNFAVRIAREEGKPAKVHVELEGKKWDTTEDKLGDLPEHVRLHIQPLLAPHGHPAQVRMPLIAPHAVRVRPDGKVEGELAVETRAVTTKELPPAATGQKKAFRYMVQPAGPDRIESKLDAIIKKLDHGPSDAIQKLQHEVKELRKDLDELRNKSPGESPAK